MSTHTLLDPFNQHANTWFNPGFKSLLVLNNITARENVTINRDLIVNGHTLLAALLVKISIETLLNYKINNNVVLTKDKLILNDGNNEISGNDYKIKLELPKKSGRLALLSDIEIPQYLNYAGNSKIHTPRGGNPGFQDDNLIFMIYPGRETSFVPKNIYTVLYLYVTNPNCTCRTGIQIYEESTNKIISEKNDITKSGIIAMNCFKYIPKKQSVLILKAFEPVCNYNFCGTVRVPSCQFSSI